MTLFASLVQDYVRLHGLGAGRPPPGRMIALAGDAELDEGNIFEALLEGWKHDVRNLWWVIDYNRQSLDAVVSDRLFGRIDALFEMFGWRVVTLKYGRLLEAAFARPDGAHLRDWIDACPNSLYSALVYKGGEGWREHLRRDLNRYPGIRAILDEHDDDALARLMTNLAGHDMGSVLDAFHAVTDDRPTCFIAYTIKGYGPALRRPQGQPRRADDARADGGLPAGDEGARRRRMGALRRARCRRRMHVRFLASAPLARGRNRRDRNAGGRRARGAAGARGRSANRPRKPSAASSADWQRRTASCRGASSPPRPTSRSRPISARGSTGAASSTAPTGSIRSARKKSSRRSAGRWGRRASTSSSASPSTICSCSSPRSAWRGRCSAAAAADRHDLRPVHQARARCAELCALPGCPLHPGGDAVGRDAGARGRRASIDLTRR